MVSPSSVLCIVMGRPIRIRDVLFTFLLGSVLLNVWLFSHLQDLEVNQRLTQLHHMEVNIDKSIGGIPESLPANVLGNGSGLRCEAYGGPYERSALADMVYWYDSIPLDHQFKSVYGQEASESYLVFEPDEAGFSNVRLSFETVVAFALAMGRTLVMPPKDPITQLSYVHPEGIRSYSYSDFFNMRHVPTISMQDYLERVALKGRLSDTTGAVTYPPFHRTNWESSNEVGKLELELFYTWLSSAMHAIDWNRDACIVAFPADRTKGVAAVSASVSSIVKEEMKVGSSARTDSFIGHPVPVNASAHERVREVLGMRKTLCIYDEYWEKSESLYISGHEKSDHRPLIPFYAFAFFEDWHRDLQMKRFMRDNLRFADVLQCAAARIVQAIRQIAAANAASHGVDASNGGSDGGFDTMHVRRSDFKNLPTYSDSTDSSEQIVKEKYFADQRTVYIATDEADTSFFAPVRKHYNLLFLSDFTHLLQGMDPNYFGMIEQLVCSKGDKFVGTYYSTFSAYINRIRGYHALKSNTSEAKEGILNSEYMGQSGTFRDAHKTYMSAKEQFWHREWPIAWRDIDFDSDWS